MNVKKKFLSELTIEEFLDLTQPIEVVRYETLSKMMCCSVRKLQMLKAEGVFDSALIEDNGHCVLFDLQKAIRAFKKHNTDSKS